MSRVFPPILLVRPATSDSEPVRTVCFFYWGSVPGSSSNRTPAEASVQSPIPAICASISRSTRNQGNVSPWGSAAHRLVGEGLVHIAKIAGHSEEPKVLAPTCERRGYCCGVGAEPNRRLVTNALCRLCAAEMCNCAITVHSVGPSNESGRTVVVLQRTTRIVSKPSAVTSLNPPQRIRSAVVATWQ